MPSKISECYLFSSMSKEVLQRVEEMSQSVALESGQILFRQGDTADKFFFVESGVIKLSRFSLDGNEKVLELMGAGAVFSERLMFLDSRRYPVTATATEKSVLRSVDNALFLELLRSSIDTCFRMMGDMSLRLHCMVNEIDHLAQHSATSRVAGYFIEQLEAQDHVNVGEKIEFRLQASKSVIASRLSIKPETFSRILHNLSDKKVIHVQGGSVKVLDLQALHKCAQANDV